MDREAWHAVIQGVTRSWTGLSDQTELTELKETKGFPYETWVRSLGWEEPLEEGLATHFSILAWRTCTHSETWRATVHGVAKSWTQLSD